MKTADYTCCIYKQLSKETLKDLAENSFRNFFRVVYGNERYHD